MVYMRVSNGRIGGLLKNMTTTGRAYRKVLRDYSMVRCEPLELFYQCRRGMNALDANLLHDLLFSYSWREANWAAWLASLRPQPAWVQCLYEKRPSLLHGTEVIDLALAACGEPVTGHLDEQLESLREIREMLNDLPEHPYLMRLSPAAEQEQQFNAEVEAIRKAYGSGGLTAASPLLRTGLIRYYGMSRREWIKAGAPKAPNVRLDTVGYAAIQLQR